MGFLNLFSGKSPEEYEGKGDRFLELGEYGAAKLEYETALDKTQRGPGDGASEERLQGKIGKSREALARQHRESAERLAESGDTEGASELLCLALELTRDAELTRDIQQALDRAHGTLSGEQAPPSLPPAGDDDSANEEWQTDDTEYFTALCGALDDERQEAYSGYGEAFMEGYVALNRGEYGRAAGLLERALNENPAGTMIPLELATAYLNLERYEEALALAEDFIRDHPYSVHGYHTLCEVLWAQDRFDEAGERLLSCPDTIADSPPILRLKGEALNRSGRHKEAESLYREMLRSHGRDEQTIVSLAVTCEALGNREEALDLYSEIMRQCRACNTRTNPFVRRKYADISLERGEQSAQILEIYLSLIEEDPAEREHHFRMVERIYAAMGNDREARRYRQFAESMKAD